MDGLSSCAKAIYNKTTNVNNEASRRAAKLRPQHKNTRCQLHIVTRVPSSGGDHSNAVTTSEIQRFKSH